MIPSQPAVEDHDHAPDELWGGDRARPPLSFHILTTRDTAPVRSPYMNAFRGDSAGTSGHARPRRGVRTPSKLRVVCVEADAGWVPLHVSHGPRLQAAPQLAARRAGARRCRPNTRGKHLPRFGTTGSRSRRQPDERHRFVCGRTTFRTAIGVAVVQEMLAEHSALTAEQRRAILCDNAAELSIWRSCLRRRTGRASLLPRSSRRNHRRSIGDDYRSPAHPRRQATASTIVTFLSAVAPPSIGRKSAMMIVPANIRTFVEHQLRAHQAGAVQMLGRGSARRAGHLQRGGRVGQVPSS